MPHRHSHYADVLRPLQLLTLVTLLLRSLPLVPAYSTHVPTVSSVCNDFQTSHKGGTASYSAWVELHDSAGKNASCYAREKRYQIVLKSTGRVKGFLLGVNRGSFSSGDGVTRERGFAVSVKCNNQLGRTISHRMVVPKGANLSFTYYSLSRGDRTLQIKAAVTFSFEENLENLQFNFPLCAAPPPTSQPQPSPTPEPTSSSSSSAVPELTSSSDVLNTSLAPSPTPLPTPSPTPSNTPCKCLATNLSCGKTVNFYFDKRNYTDGGKNYTCTTRKAIRIVTCNSTCTRECTATDCKTPVDLVCKADSQVKRKKYNCQEVDYNGVRKAGTKTIIKRLELTIYPRCTCKQHSLLSI